MTASNNVHDIVEKAKEHKAHGSNDYTDVYKGIVQLQQIEKPDKFMADMKELNAELHAAKILPGVEIAGADKSNHLLAMKNDKAIVIDAKNITHTKPFHSYGGPTPATPGAPEQQTGKPDAPPATPESSTNGGKGAAGAGLAGAAVEAAGAAVSGSVAGRAAGSLGRAGEAVAQDKTRTQNKPHHGGALPAGDTPTQGGDHIPPPTGASQTAGDKTHSSGSKPQQPGDKTHAAGDQTHTGGAKSQSAADKAAADKAHPAPDKAHTAAHAAHAAGNKTHADAGKTQSASGDKTHQPDSKSDSQSQS